MADGAGIAGASAAPADRIVFLGHATVLIELGGTRLLTDPVLRGRVAHLRRQAPAIAGAHLGPPDAVLISHLHHDHLDIASLRRLGVGTPLIVPAGAGAWLRAKGFAAVTEVDAGDVVAVGEVAVRAVPAHHDGRRPGGPPAATLGYVVQGRRSVYFAGDTEFFAAMAEIAPSLDVALLPVAGWGPTLGPGHMGPEDAARAAAVLKPRIAIPVHWGTLAPIGMARSGRATRSDPPRRFADHVARLATGVEVRVLAPGEETQIGEGPPS